MENKIIGDKNFVEEVDGRFVLVNDTVSLEKTVVIDKVSEKTDV